MSTTQEVLASIKSSAICRSNYCSIVEVEHIYMLRQDLIQSMDIGE